MVRLLDAADQPAPADNAALVALFSPPRGARPASPARGVLPGAGLVLALLSAVLALTAVKWSGDALADEVTRYGWRSSTTDAALAAQAPGWPQ